MLATPSAAFFCGLRRLAEKQITTFEGRTDLHVSGCRGQAKAVERCRCACGPYDGHTYRGYKMNKKSLSWLERPSRYRVAKVVMVVGPAAFSLGWGLDVYVPAIPHVMEDFQTNQRSIQLTFGMFMLFCGLGQVVFGPLSDHFGRRSIAIISGLLFTFGSALCALAQNVETLVLSRIIEATGKIVIAIPCIS